MGLPPGRKVLVEAVTPPRRGDNYNSSVDACDRPAVCKPAYVGRRMISGVQAGFFKWLLRAAGS